MTKNRDSKLVNAWIFLNEDEPKGTNYNSPNSCYQTLITNNVYQSVDILFLCFVTTVKVDGGESYTIEMGESGHPEGLTNQDYMEYITRDARINNPGIKIAVTLDWGTGDLLSNIFSNTKCSPSKNADNFATNLVAYLKKYNLDGFDIDWERPISTDTTKDQFTLLVNAIGKIFKAQKDRDYYLTLSPAEVGNLDAEAVNCNVSFVNLQLYSGFTSPAEFVSVGVSTNLFSYGAKFESNYQTAEQAYNDNITNYHYDIYTNWRLNSDNYAFEQEQQKILYSKVHLTCADVSEPDNIKAAESAA